jgi:tripartite-type tricarboxylate transporter receptor subunit TctC
VVPYKAPPQMLQALVTGEVNAGVTSLGSIEKQLAGGKLRMLAVTTEERHPAFPNIPTFGEIGIKLPLRPWFGIVGPSGIPRDIVAWMNTEVGRLAVEPEFRSRLLDANGILFQPNTADEFAAFLKRNREQFAELLKIVPVKPN